MPGAFWHAVDVACDLDGDLMDCSRTNSNMASVVEMVSRAMLVSERALRGYAQFLWFICFSL